MIELQRGPQTLPPTPAARDRASASLVACDPRRFDIGADSPFHKIVKPSADEHNGDVFHLASVSGGIEAALLPVAVLIRGESSSAAFGRCRHNRSPRTLSIGIVHQSCYKVYELR